MGPGVGMGRDMMLLVDCYVLGLSRRECGLSK